MDNYNGYKLKPKEYSIQPNDVIIRVIPGAIVAVPTGTIALALGDSCVSIAIQQCWSVDFTDWRAIETLPGSEAKAGDTVYCINDTRGSCRQHDSFAISNYYPYSNSLSPVEDHVLLNGTIAHEWRSWPAQYFVVLVKEELSTASPEPTPVDPFEAKPGDYVEWDENTYSTMTKGQFYKVIKTSPNLLTILNNLNRRDTWSKERFKRVSDKTNQEPVLISSDDHIDALAYALREPISYIAIDSMINKPKQTNSKGNQMNSNLFTDILKLLTQTEQTDLEKAPSTYAFFYNDEGEYEGTARVANETEAKALLQKPEHLGYTMRIYSFSDEFTTQIPVVSTIKKTVAVKPARKPRATKA